MIYKYRKFKSSILNEGLEPYYDIPFDTFYEKRESLKFKDDVCHILDDLSDSGVGIFNYDQGYALSFDAASHDWLVLRKSSIDYHRQDLNSMVSVESDGYGLDCKNINFIVDCVTVERNYIELPNLKNYEMCGGLWTSQMLSHRSKERENHYQGVKNWYESDKNFIESIQRIMRLDKSIIVIQDDYSLECFSIIFA